MAFAQMMMGESDVTTILEKSFKMSDVKKPIRNGVLSDNDTNKNQTETFLQGYKKYVTTTTKKKLNKIKLFII